MRAGFRELKSEFKKVVWPTKKQILKNTAVVLVVLLAVGIVVGLLDFAFEKLILSSFEACNRVLMALSSYKVRFRMVSHGG